MTKLLNGTAVRHVRAPGKGGVCLKKGCALYLLCLAAVILALFPGTAPAEKAAGTVEELESFFLRCRENRRERFTVTCSDALLKQLQADEFHALFRLFGALGMQVPSVSWSSRGELIFERVVYDPEIHYADVPSDPEQVRDCLRQFADEGAAYFALTGESSLIEDLFQGRLLRILSGLGMEVRGLTGNPEAGYLRVSSMAPFDAPFSCVEDIYYAASAMSGYRDRGEGTFYLVFDEAAFSALTERDRRIMEFLGGVESAVRYVNDAACLYRYEEVTWQDVPSMLCSTDEEIIGAMRHAGSDSFRIMLSQPLWEEVSGHAFRHLFELEGQAGMRSGQFSVMEEDHILMFEDVQVVSDAVGIEEPSRIREVLTACAQRGDRECTMFLAPELYALVMKGDGQGLSALASQAGIRQYAVIYSRFSGMVSMDHMEYTAGTEILRARRTGTEEALPERMLKTLEVAERAAEACKREKDVETARALHDWLCGHTDYAVTEDSDEDDCCIGALLTGQANCDGYADAFCLLGNLAGLEVMCQEGTAGDGNHMWNLFRTEGTWRMIDATWDDQERTLDLWFNTGYDRAVRDHAWAEEMGPELMPETFARDRTVSEYRIRDMGDAGEYLGEALSAGEKTVDLYLTDDCHGSQEELKAEIEKTAAAPWSCLWTESLRCMRVWLGPDI